MEQVNPGIKRKTRYLIVDAVGVCERGLTESRPLEKKPTVSFNFTQVQRVSATGVHPEALPSFTPLILANKRTNVVYPQNDPRRVTQGKSS